MSGDFVHLHLHTQYSLLDGANRVKDLIRNVKASGMDSVAVTDHGNMFGAYDLQTTSLEAGIKPIIGVEAYIAPGSRHDRENVKTFDGEGNNYHLTLLVETPEGYKNLARLVSEAFLSGFYYKPRMDWELLEKYHEGIIALSGCLNGEVPKRLRAGDYEGAKKVALKYQALFGKDRYFIEIMDHGLPEQRQILPDLLRLSQETGIPPVATNDSHYLTRDDAAAQDVLLCIGTGKTLNDAKRMKFYNSEFYVKSPEEMSDVFRPWTLEAVRNTAAIADRITPSVIIDTGLKIPTYPVPVPDRNPDEYLEDLAKEGLEKRLAHPAPYPAGSRPPKTRAEYDERLTWELSVILKMGLSSYFLIVWDFIKYAKDEGIPVGPGRGSAAGSLVAWSLGITDVDPLRYDLLFERFLNPDRISMPDIDVDLCERRRGEVIEYVRRKYGRDNVGQIITFNSMKARAVIRDVGRVLDVPLAEVNRLCSLIPANPGKPTMLAEARRDVKELADALRDNETVPPPLRPRGASRGRLAARGRPRGRRAHRAEAARRVPAALPQQQRRDHDPVRDEVRRQDGPPEDGLPRPHHAHDPRRRPRLRREEDGREARSRDDSARRPRGLQALRGRADGRRLPVRVVGHAGPSAPRAARGVRRPRGPERALPPGRAGRRNRRGLHRAPARQEVRLPAPAARADPEGDARGPRVPGAGHARGARRGRATRPARRTSSARRSARRTTRSSRPRATSS